MTFEHIYDVASFIVMLIVLLCVFKMYLTLTAACREHRAFLLYWERDKGGTTKSKQRTERTWSGKKEQCRRRKTRRVRSSTSPSATWWTTVSRSKGAYNPRLSHDTVAGSRHSSVLPCCRNLNLPFLVKTTTLVREAGKFSRRFWSFFSSFHK